MRGKLKYLIFFGVLTVIIALLLSHFDQTPTTGKTVAQNIALEKAILDCDNITEKAAAHLVAVVEFQKLEIAGRKAHVFKQCMGDRGYIENEAWLNDNQTVAQKTAKEMKISISEALENLRRLHMEQPYGEGDRPSYWILRKQPASD